ncbi:hypothetical protein OUZ56_031973 [Daphnia magna]|uniref:Uncharacterized protein n=1 Tax=Daphnia magna TaxID=35525 RepID=A0ABQ9ZVS0_9CRUS|nr:hypothetical protein OUZ56_031973 [Daphnia magna]
MLRTFVAGWCNNRGLVRMKTRPYWETLETFHHHIPIVEEGNKKEQVKPSGVAHPSLSEKKKDGQNSHSRLGGSFTDILSARSLFTWPGIGRLWIC